jgi:hypothetical protein
MEKQQEGRWVVPNPQIPHSFGLMNIVFGVLLILYGAGSVLLTYYGQALVKGFQVHIEAQLATKKAQREAQIADLKEKVKTAKTEAEKKDLESNIQALELRKEPNLAAANEAMNVTADPRIQFYVYTETLAAIVLNVMMVISGVGLLFLAEWARRLAIVVALLKIARWIAMFFATIFVIVPITTPKMKQVMDSVKVQTAGSGTPAVASAIVVQASQMSAGIAAVTMVGEILIACVYPVCLIWFLTRPPARAACLAMTARRRIQPGREPAGP